MDLFDNLFVFIVVGVMIFILVGIGLTLPIIHFSAIGEVEQIEAEQIDHFFTC